MSTIDELNRLLAESQEDSPRPWKADTQPAEHAEINDKDGRPVAETLLDADALAIIALHNAWPAIHRVLVAARETKERMRQMHDAPSRMPTIHIHRTMLLQALIEPIEKALAILERVKTP